MAKKPIIFIPPVSSSLLMLKEVLQAIVDEENLEIFDVANMKEAEQVIPTLGPCLILFSEAKMTADFLKVHKKNLQKNKAKTFLLSSNKLPFKIADKFAKAGLSELAFEPLPPKTLLHKVKILAKALPTPKNEEEEEDLKVKQGTSENQTTEIESPEVKSLKKVESIDKYMGQDNHIKSKKEDINFEEAETENSSKRPEVIDDGEDFYKKKQKEELELEEAYKKKKKNYQDDDNIESYYKNTESKYKEDGIDELLTGKKEKNTNLVDDNGNYWAKDKKEEIYLDEANKVEKKKSFELEESENDSTKKKNNLLDVEENDSTNAKNSKAKIQVDEDSENNKNTDGLEIEDNSNTKNDKLKNKTLFLDEEAKQSEQADLLEDIQKKSKSNSKLIDVDEEDNNSKENKKKNELSFEDDESDNNSEENEELQANKRNSLSKNKIDLEDQSEEDENDTKNKLELEPSEDEARQKNEKLELNNEKDTKSNKENKLNLETEAAEKENQNNTGLLVDEEKSKKENEEKLNKTDKDLNFSNEELDLLTEDNEKNTREKEKNKLNELNNEDMLVNSKKSTNLFNEDGQDEESSDEILTETEKLKRLKKQSGLLVEDSGSDVTKGHTNTEHLDKYYGSKKKNQSVNQNWDDLLKKNRTEELSFDKKKRKADEDLDYSMKGLGEQTINYAKLKEEFQTSGIFSGVKKSVKDPGNFSRGKKSIGDPTSLLFDSSLDNPIFQEIGVTVNPEQEILEDVINPNSKSIEHVILLQNKLIESSNKDRDFYEYMSRLILKEFDGYCVFFHKDFTTQIFTETYNSFIQLPPSDEKLKNEIFQEWEKLKIEKEKWEKVRLPEYLDQHFLADKNQIIYPYYEGVETMGFVFVYFDQKLKRLDVPVIEMLLESLKTFYIGPYHLYKKSVESSTTTAQRTEDVTSNEEKSNVLTGFFSKLFGKKKAS